MPEIGDAFVAKLSGSLAFTLPPRMARILFLPPNHELEGAVGGAFGSLLGNNFLGSNLAPNSPILSPSPANQPSSAGAGVAAGATYVGIGAGAGAT
jgi:hypothetical protein